MLQLRGAAMLFVNSRGFLSTIAKELDRVSKAIVMKRMHTSGSCSFGIAFQASLEFK